MNFLLRCFVVFALACSQLYCADESSEATKFYANNPEKIMLNGYDILSYYTSPHPIKGSPEYQIEYQGTKWYFSNKINRNKFQKNPEMYIPEVGGYCVWAIAHGRLTGGNPQVWKLLNGRLYFFDSESARAKWMLQRELIIRMAKENWSEIIANEN